MLVYKHLFTHENNSADQSSGLMGSFQLTVPGCDPGANYLPPVVRNMSPDTMARHGEKNWAQWESNPAHIQADYLLKLDSSGVGKPTKLSNTIDYCNCYRF